MLHCLTLGGQVGVLSGMSGAQTLHSSLLSLNPKLTPPV